MINIETKKKCYSCSACKEQCPSNAISFDDNLFPIIDLQKCINCGICEKTCISSTECDNRTVSSEWKGYVAINNDVNIRMRSSSGGLFYQMAKKVIDEGGYVCGCVFDEAFMPKHVVTNSIKDVNEMMGSKYVKSDLQDCIGQIKSLTKADKTVLFSGVPCQVAAVKSCVTSEKLITIAVVCHGSIERSNWKMYLEEESQLGNIIAVSMRDKSQGWLNYGLRFDFSDGSEHITYRKSDGYFLKCFTDGLFERDRCLKCEYKANNIISDILLGDAWGMDTICPELVDCNGTSVVVTITDKGKRFFADINDIQYKEVQIHEIIKRNQRIISSAPENHFRKKFNNEIGKNNANLHKICKKYAKATIINRIKWKLAAIRNGNVN